METPLHVRRRRTNGMRQEHVRDAPVASRHLDDRSTPRKDHVVLRRMARGLRDNGLDSRAIRGRVTNGIHVRIDNEEPHRHRRSHGGNERASHDKTSPAGTRPCCISYRTCFLKTKRVVPSVLTLTTWWCSRIHATRRRCRTWLGRCIQDARNSYRKRLKMPRGYRTVIYWSISNRTRPRTCVCARPSFQTTTCSTCTCRRYKRPGT